MYNHVVRRHSFKVKFNEALKRNEMPTPIYVWFYFNKHMRAGSDGNKMRIKRQYQCHAMTERIMCADEAVAYAHV